MPRLPSFLVVLAMLGLVLGAGAMARAEAKAAEPCPMAGMAHADHHAPAGQIVGCAACCIVVSTAELTAGPQARVARPATRPALPARLDGEGRTIKPGHGPPRRAA